MVTRPERKTTMARMEAVEVPASEVKNAWHEWLDRVSRMREEVVITRYGRPIARLSPVEPGGEEQRLFGCMAGTVTIHGDIIEPIEVEWEADAC
ncbi:MAG TPA: type II toxin-antitoxin system prevent-host-death family antitoxin [Gemmatimonadales bacterium]